tara:strand:- start:87 stop:284 length:198 start_codon:yes stop_codon:yes gene_type:complete
MSEPHAVVHINADGVEITEGTSNVVRLSDTITVVGNTVVMNANTLSLGGVTVTSAQLTQLLATLP